MKKNKLNIWLVQVGEPLPVDPAVRRQRLTTLADALAERGHKITRWGSAFDHLTKRFISSEHEIEQQSDIKIKLIRGCGYKKNFSIKRYFDHWLLAKDFIRKARQCNAPDIIIVATPPHNIAQIVVRFARKKDIPVIVDIRDQWPDIFLPEKSNLARRVVKFFLSRDFAQIREALRKADSITAVSKDFLEWGLSYADREKRREDKVFHIGTGLAEKVAADNISDRLRQMIEKGRGKTRFLFVGSFGKLQNPLLIIKAAKKFKEARKPAFFILAGDGEYMEKVLEEADGLENVIIPGWLKHEEIMYLLNNVDVGMCPLNRVLPLFPNKAFMYFSAYVPVISSAYGELRELIETEKVGLNYEPEDIRGLESNIERFLEDEELLGQMSTNVKRCFRERFDSGIIYGRFCDHIENIAGRDKDGI